MVARGCLAVLFLLAPACSTHLAASTDARVSCHAQRECPEGSSCNTALAMCLVSGSTPPKQSVSFVQPSSGATNVSTTATLIIAFALPVDLATATAHVALSDDSGATLPLTVQASSEANTLFVTPDQELGSLTHYTLTLAAGIAVATAGVALPSDSAEQVGFTTAIKRDATPPTPASNAGLLFDRKTASAIDISWNNPADSDLAGALIIRKKGAPLLLDPTVAPNDLPAAGVAYAGGQPVGSAQDGAEVAAAVSGTATSLVDLDPLASYDFAILWFDKSSNYSPPRRAPYIPVSSVLWCPSETGTFTLQSPDTGMGALMLQRTNEPSYHYLPAANDQALNSDVVFSANDVTLGATYALRFSATNDDGEFRSTPQPFIASRADLSPYAQPGGVGVGKVGLNAQAAFGFSAYGWPLFEVAVDTNPEQDPPPQQPPIDNDLWSASTLQSAAVATYPMSNAGYFKIRARPVVVGCVGAKFLAVSDEFLVGDGVRYVSATNGSDSNDGLSRSTPYATLAKALSVSHGAADLDILVSEGTYPEGVPLQSYIRILGGYASDFAARDPGPRVAPAQHETIFTGTVAIRGDSNSLTGMYAPISAKAVVVDGVTIRPNGSTPNIYGAYMDNSWTACCGGVQGNGSEVTLRNDRISSGVPSASSATARAIYFGCDATQVLDGSVVTSFGTDAYNDVGVFGGCIGYVGSTLTLTNNLIRATIGVTYDAPYNVGFAPTNALIMFGNRIEGRDEPGAPLGATTSGLRTSGSGPKLDVHDNVFVPNRASYLGGQNSEGFHPSGSSWGTFANNVIDGGHNADNSFGVFLEGTPPAGTTFAVVNNLVSAGVGAHRREGLHTYNVSGNVVFAHNTVIAMADGLTLPVNYGLTFVEASGGRVLNNFFFGQYSIPSQLLAGTLDSFQNNLVFAPSSLTLINGVPPSSDVPTFETYACAHGVAASGTAVVTSLNGLFAPNADADGDWTTVTDSAWIPLVSAESTFAIGLDTAIAQCGAGACNGTGASWCGGALAKDLTGKTRTAPPVVGAYQP